MKSSILVALDRDGVLNQMVVDSEHGTVDSPLHPSQVRLCDGVPEALARLTKAGVALVVATNQPAFAKGKTTRENLEAVHSEVLRLAQAAGGRILSSHICFHRREDGCTCRKPGTGLLEEAFRLHPWVDRHGSWMVGDGVTDVQAGIAYGLKTAFIGPKKADVIGIFHDLGVSPLFWGASILEFTDYLIQTNA